MKQTLQLLDCTSSVEMDEDAVKIEFHSRIHLHDRQNHIVSTQPVHETAVSRRPSLSLPNDVIFEILLRLPVRYLLQFKCVCKSWETLISDPQFAKSHLRCSIADPSMTHKRLVFSKPVLFTKHCEIVSFPLKPLFENPTTFANIASIMMSHNYDIFGSCNGLLCLYDRNHGYFELWNPATRLKSKRSPIIHDKIINNYGFGYNQVNDKYKVLVAAGVHFRKIVTKIYTFGANSWTTIHNFSCTPTRYLGKFMSGTLNWVANKGVSWVIHSFDLEKETYREMLLPKQDGNNTSNYALHVLRNCLCCMYFDFNKTQWVVWLMKEYGVVESWTKLMVIPRDKLWNPYWMSFFELLWLSENGVVLVKTPYSELVLYDSKVSKLAYSKILSKDGLDLLVYHESLVSPQW